MRSSPNAPLPNVSWRVLRTHLRTLRKGLLTAHSIVAGDHDLTEDPRPDIRYPTGAPWLASSFPCGNHSHPGATARALVGVVARTRARSRRQVVARIVGWSSEEADVSGERSSSCEALTPYQASTGPLVQGRRRRQRSAPSMTSCAA